ncbi:MAG: tol-pal system protein YbgF [Thermoanaerobaculia bacterium]
MTRALRVGSLVALLATAGCAGPYWSRADRARALERDEAERRARSTAPSDLQPESARAAEPEPVAMEPPPQTEAAAPPIAAETLPPEDEAANALRPGATIDESDLEPEPASAPPAAVPAEASGGLDLQALYDSSFERFQRGEFAAAESGFRQILARYPRSDLADNAQYWIAESYERRGDEARALLEFRAVVERYPEGNKVPDALLKVARAVEREGDRTSAFEIYRELVKRYPGTVAAENARTRLATP